MTSRLSPDTTCSTGRSQSHSHQHTAAREAANRLDNTRGAGVAGQGGREWRGQRDSDRRLASSSSSSFGPRDRETVCYHYSFTGRNSSSSRSDSSDSAGVINGTRRLHRMRGKLRKPTKESSGSGTELLVFTLFLVVMMLTLSQVLVVHHKYNGRYGQAAHPRSMRIKAQQDLRMVDRSIAALRRQNIPTPQQDAESLQKHVYANRIARMIQRASEESRVVLQHRARLLTNSTSSSSWAESASASSAVSSSPLLTAPRDSVSNVTNTRTLYNASGLGGDVEGNFSNLTSFLEDAGIANVTLPPPLSLCPEEPPSLWGNVSGDVNKEHETLTMSQLTLWHPDLMPGGEWKPVECVARYRLAVIIPYRDRLAHLTVLLAHLLPILKRQQLHFRIFVVEQSTSDLCTRT